MQISEPTPEVAEVVANVPPLTLPKELWVTLSREHQLACQNADALLNVFGDNETLPLREVFQRTSLGVEETLAGLRVLDTMLLVKIEGGSEGPRVKLVALPEEHVRVVGLDGRTRWLLVARPLTAPVFDRLSLN